MRILLAVVLSMFVFVSPVLAEQLIADFESWPNVLGGEIGVYGSCEPNWDTMYQQPYSWIYEPVSYGYDEENVHSGRQAWRLITGTGAKPNEMWGSFALDLGPTLDITVVPKKVDSFDASRFDKITFWVKGKEGGEKMKFLLRDSHALNYMPQQIVTLPDATTEWQEITIKLGTMCRVDLTCLDNIGIAFGPDCGNLKGDTIFLDDFKFE